MRYSPRSFMALGLATGVCLAGFGACADDAPAAAATPTPDAVTEPAQAQAKKPPAKKTATTAKPTPAAKPDVVRGAPAPSNANAAINKNTPVGAAGKNPSKPAAAKPGTSPTDKKQAKPAEPAALKPLLSEKDRAIYKDAFAKATDGKWAEAQKVAASAKEKLPAKLLRALELGASTDFAAITQFMAANPDWPHQNAMRARAEEAVAGQGDAVLLDWFQQNPPQTTKGQTALADAFYRAGKTAEADALIRTAWVNANFDAREERQFFDRYRRTLGDADHLARLDRLLWDNQVPAAQRMMQRVDEPHRRLATARIRLMRLQGGFDTAIQRVPEELRNDPGLIYERLHFRRRKGDFEGARGLLLNLPHDLRRSAEWWQELSYVIRRTLDAGDVSLAYRLAKEHRQDGGPSFAEAEFLAGWISLRFLHEPPQAREHFQALHDFVKFPVSKSRAAYWLGRTAETANDAATAGNWYAEGAKHLTTFYGQLSAGRLKMIVASLPPEPAPTKEQADAFERAELPRLTRMMAELGERERTSQLFRHMSSAAKEPHEFASIASLAAQMAMPDEAVRAARRAERAGAPLTALGYPVVPLNRAPDSLPPALIYALIRQESGFDREAVSRAGARGLMQLMPDTARLVAKEINVSYQPHQLTEDPAFNVMLGRAYLHRMIEEMGGVPAALAAYNAGPSRAKRWVRSNGDPRVDEDALVDWIELIPFDETRNYVQRVLEGEFVYRLRDAKPAPQRPAAEASSTPATRTP